MFLPENFRNFIKSKMSTELQTAYQNSSFKDLATSLKTVLAKIKSRLSSFNAYTSISDMMLSEFDPEYLASQQFTGENVKDVIFETSLGNEIHQAVDELIDLNKEADLVQDGSPTPTQRKSLSAIGPDGKQYDIVWFESGTYYLDVPDFANVNVLLATCEDPTELADLILFIGDDDKYYINPMLRSVDFMNGEYIPSDSLNRLILWCQLKSIPDFSPSDTFSYNCTAIADYYGIDYEDDLQVLNWVLTNIYDDGVEGSTDDATISILRDQYSAEPIGSPTGAVTAFTALASSFAEKASIDEIHSKVGDVVLNSNFNIAALTAIVPDLPNLRNSVKSIVSNVSSAFMTGGLTGIVTYLVEYYRQESQMSADTTEAAWSFTDQQSLIPKNFTTNVASIFVQVFSSLVQVIGSFFNVIGRVIAGVLYTGLQMLDKFINFVNDKGRAYYVESPVHLSAANLSIFQGWIPAQYVSLKLLRLLQANTNVFCQVPGGLMIMSLDSHRNRILLDVHPLINHFDETKLLLSSVAYEATNSLEVGFKNSLNTAEGLLNLYAANVSAPAASFDPGASEVASEDYDVRNRYLSASSDALMFKDMRLNASIFWTFVLFLSGYAITALGYDASYRGASANFLPMRFALQGYSLSDVNYRNVSSNWGFGTWTNFATECAKLCSFTQSLWDPDVPVQSIPWVWDHYVADPGTWYREAGTVNIAAGIGSFSSGDTILSLTDIVSIPHNAQFSLIAPKWNSSSFWQVFFGTAVLSAIIATVVIIGSIAIKRKISSIRANKQVTVEKAWDNFKKNPNDPQAYNQFRKSVRKNNMFANVFGGTKYSTNNYWETIGSDSSPVFSDQSEGTITTLLSDTTGTDTIPDPYNKILRLISGEIIA